MIEPNLSKVRPFFEPDSYNFFGRVTSSDDFAAYRLQPDFASFLAKIPCSDTTPTNSSMFFYDFK